ncbi:MAG: peptidylprolyl isomerase SurA [Alteromonas sp.]
MKSALLSIVLLIMTSPLAAQEVKLDSVAVIVDQGVILESEIQELITTVKRNAVVNNQSLPSDRALRTQAIERLILNNLQMQMADRMGIQISDPQLDQTIRNIAQNEGMTLEQLRSQIALEGLTYDNYRENVRQELITGEVTRANVRRRIYITPQEISTLVDLIDQQGAEQAEYQLGHILIGFPPQATDDDIDAAKDRAERVIELLETGSDFAKIAIASSSGAEALEGGNMGWMNINSMPTLFAEAVQSKRKDALIGPIRSGAGFHILKVLDTRGIDVVEVEEVNARHILIEPSIILSEERAKEMLAEFKQQLIAGEADFAELAKEHSADPGSALRGGELGFADPNIYVPEFRDALAGLGPDEYSEPVRSVHGWHLIQLIERRIDDATERRKEDRAYQLIFNRKFAEETDSWLREMRDAAYIEVVGDGNA